MPDTTNQDMSSPTASLDWKVIAVFDPEGLGGDFAYTVGLADLGLDELHVWARPPDGFDPGEDFKLSPQDMAALLNQCATQLKDGKLPVGHTFTQEFNDGWAHGIFNVAAPQDRQELEAFSAHPAARVRTIRWSLERKVGPAETEVTKSTQLDICTQTDVWAKVLANLTGVLPVVEYKISPDGLYGPWTEVVELVSNVLWELDVESMGDLLRATSEVAGMLAHTQGTISAAALACGRSRAIDNCAQKAQEDAAEFTATLASELFDADTATDEKFLGFCRQALYATLFCSYGTWALCDVLAANIKSRVFGLLDLVCRPEESNDRFYQLDVVQNVVSQTQSLPTTTFVKTLGDAGVSLEQLYEACDWARAHTSVTHGCAPNTTVTNWDDSWDESQEIQGEIIDAAAAFAALSGWTGPNMAVLETVSRCYFSSIT